MGEVLPLDKVLRALLSDQGLDGVDVLLLQHGLDHLLKHLNIELIDPEHGAFILILKLTSDLCSAERLLSGVLTNIFPSTFVFFESFSLAA